MHLLSKLMHLLSKQSHSDSRATQKGASLIARPLLRLILNGCLSVLTPRQE